ncbi:MAG: hypothetical protein A3K09_01605 [Nitrospinae bacterium RIFCSPLOWO2_12_FULL_47_7]|nr:MAG: hypothetical protein A3K09_01605 [Nitrospinae bacterium RIFCSPLOWO2_12_FULL_47_7]
MLQKVLLIENDRIETETIRALLEKQDYEVITAYSANEAKQRLRDKIFHFVIFGAKIVAETGQNLFSLLHQEIPEVAGLVITGFQSQPEVLVTARQCGYDTLKSPFSAFHLLEIIRHAGPAREASPDRFSRSKESDAPELLGNSPVIRRLRETLFAVAQTDVTTLLRGETGTGKELAARFIHSKSSRVGKRLVAINCSALTESLLESELFGHEKGAFTGAHKQKLGKFEYAGQGTLFLDEIGEMSPHLQAKMLRVIDDREFERVGGNRTLKVDCRIISASNIDFPKALKEGRFREDLYHRLNVISIELPSLRQHMDDIPLLSSHFLSRYAAKYSKNISAFSQEAMRQLNDYPWPGNVRELENAIERSVILASGNILEHLPIPAGEHKRPPLFPPAPEDSEHLTLKEMQKKVLAHYEKSYLEKLLQTHNGHISHTALAAGIDRKTFYRKIDEHHINPAQYKKKRPPQLKRG